MPIVSTPPLPPLGLRGNAAEQAAVETSADWLARGWADLKAHPALSLGFGLVYVAGAYILTFGALRAGLGSLVPALASGFMLIAPFAALGLYEISRRREAGEPVDWGPVLTCWRRAGPQIGGVALVLMLLQAAWLQLALLIFMLFYGAAPPQLDSFVSDVLTAPQAPLFLLVGGAVGGVIATIAFAVSVVSLPMLLDRPVSALDAMRTSIAVVRANARAMIGWAATLALLSIAGMAVFFIGLAITLPLAGHASWHAYRALVPPAEGGGA